MRKAAKMMSCYMVLLAAILVMAVSPTVRAEDKKPEIKRLEDMVVKEEAGAPGLKVSPSETVIEIDDFETIGPQTSVLDVLKTQSIVDLRGQTELDPGVDSIYMRGFGATRFVTAIDQLTVQKTGGRKSSNIVDYALLPTFLVDKVEILPGPHSALYDSKSIGGVLNFISKAPEKRDSLKPDISFSTSYGSYDTMTNNAVVRGGIKAFTYDLAYRKYNTDGFLRHNETDIDTFYARMGLLLPQDGFVTLSTSYSVVGRNAPVNNPGQAAPYLNDYDPDYPTVTKSAWDPVQNPTWDGRSVSYRLNVDQPSPIGHLTLG
ncbi:MAG: TonB-dependent receptor plug domain-containing protein, partial [Desulfobacteraceae bacterium]